MLTMWCLAILHHLGWAAGPWELPEVTALSKGACYIGSVNLDRAASSAGRALRSQCRGRGFDPPAVHQNL